MQRPLTPRRPGLYLAAALIILIGAAWPARAQTGSRTQPAESGRQLYDASCAACHGADGAGVPASRLGFETPVPDFTDCSFATPEADATASGTSSTCGARPVP